MEGFGPFWVYHQESLEDVNQRLVYTTIELERVKMESQEQMRKHRQDVKQLLDLLNTCYKERDDLQNILNKLLISCNNSPESPLLLPVKANSSITESNNSHNSRNSSPVDSLFDSVSSPDSSNAPISPNFTPISPTFTPISPNFTPVSPNLTDFHRVSNVKMDPIDCLVKGKRLPEKGKLLEAVTEAGPLLQTLLVAGPLPRWRNPPPMQTFKIPPVAIKGCHTTVNNSGGRKQPSSSSSSVLSFTKRQRLH